MIGTYLAHGWMHLFMVWYRVHDALVYRLLCMVDALVYGTC
jgi:hypothetical protein